MPENEVFSMASYTPTPSASKAGTKNGRAKKTAAKAGAKNGKKQSTAPVATYSGRGSQTIVRKSNDLIQNAMYSLSLSQQKLMLHIFAMIKPSDTELPRYEMSIYEFLKLCGVDPHNGSMYKQVKKNIEDIANAKVQWIRLAGTQKITMFRWLSSATIDEGTGKIVLTLDQSLKPHLIQLKEFYTTMNITYTLPMKSQYSLKIYELCKSYQNLYLTKKQKGEPLVWNIETLKKQVDCNAANWAHVRRTVLDKAKSEINGHTDIYFDYEVYEKDRQRVIAIAVTIEPVDKQVADDKLNEITKSMSNRVRSKKGKPIKTWFITGKKRRDMYGFLDKQIAAGHQVYIVCPAIEENEAMGDLQAVTTYYTETACALLPNRRIGLLHGKLKPKEKDEVMQKFKAGELDVLVSTTVIEVGVDVPNATVMVIENAERFGLSALHQLRGRVGRGAADSCCILISDNVNESVRERLQFLCRTPDGFAVAKYDLETRGPGDFFGAAQHGLPTLRVADLVQDTKTLRVAQDEAKALLAKDPNLIDPAHRALSDEVERLFETAGAMN